MARPLTCREDQKSTTGSKVQADSFSRRHRVDNSLGSIEIQSKHVQLSQQEDKSKLVDPVGHAEPSSPTSDYLSGIFGSVISRKQGLRVSYSGGIIFNSLLAFLWSCREISVRSLGCACNGRRIKQATRYIARKDTSSSVS